MVNKRSFDFSALPVFRGLMSFPDPKTLHPCILPDGVAHKGTVFLKAALRHPRIKVGAYTYMSAHSALEDPDDIAARLAPHLFPESPERLIIGRFCQIAHGVQFITSSANHRFDGLSSFPFAIFDGGIGNERPSLPGPGPDTCVGHDVWIGTGAMILPGARIGSGVIVGAGAAVGGDVPPYTIVAGNPARVVRHRLSEQDAERMMQLAWWNWPIDHILRHEALICGGDLDAVEAVAPPVA